MTLRPTPIDEVWPRIEAIAHEIIDGDDLSAGYMRTECLADRALCLANDEGVVIATLVPNTYRHDVELVILLAVAFGPHGAYERHLPQIDALARDLGASRIVFYTRRKGWERRLGDGWRMRDISFVRELP